VESNFKHEDDNNIKINFNFKLKFEEPDNSHYKTAQVSRNATAQQTKRF
jgi:hypothetical protein